MYSKGRKGNPWHDANGRFCKGPSNERMALVDERNLCEREILTRKMSEKESNRFKNEIKQINDRINQIDDENYVFKPNSWDTYPDFFTPKNVREERCASMCESLICYGEGMDSKYLDEYRESLGEERVTEIFNTLKENIERDYVIEYAGTDSEGVSYNGIRHK